MPSGFGDDPFEAFSPQPVVSPVNTPFQPTKRKRKAIPDQRELFKLQRQLQAVNTELDHLARLHPDVDQHLVRGAFRKAWTTLNEYLTEWKQ